MRKLIQSKDVWEELTKLLGIDPGRRIMSLTIEIPPPSDPYIRLTIKEYATTEDRHEEAGDGWEVPPSDGAGEEGDMD